MSSLLGTAQQVGTLGFGTAQALQKSLAGHPDLLHFLDPATSSVILQCDAILSETHTRESTPTAFPLESGGVISDHIVVAPFELQLQGLITDTPIGDKHSLITEAIATGLTAVAPPLGVAVAGAAYSLFQASQAANGPQTSGTAPQSRSVTAFETLQRLQQGFPGATPPVPPKPFDVKSRYRRYASMVIKSLSIPRDNTISGAIVFQLSLVQMLVVRPQTANVQIVSDQALGGARQHLGEQGLEKDDAASEAQKDAITDHGNLKSSVGRTTSIIGALPSKVAAAL